MTKTAMSNSLGTKVAGNLTARLCIVLTALGEQDSLEQEQLQL